MNCMPPVLQRYNKHHSPSTSLLKQGGAEGLKERGCLGAQEKSVPCQVQARAVVLEETYSHLVPEHSVVLPQGEEAPRPARSCLQDQCQPTEVSVGHVS